MSGTRLFRPGPADFGSGGREPAAIRLLERRLAPAAATALDRLAPDSLPNFRSSGPAEEICRWLRDGLEEVSWPAWLADWLVGDVRFLADLYRQATGADGILLRMETIGTDACRRFHADNVRFRLVTTYRGPGTQWLPPDLIARLPAYAVVPAAAIRQLDRGTVALLRGSRDAVPGLPGVLHRSPPIAGTGVTRLFLAIDEAPED